LKPNTYYNYDQASYVFFSLHEKLKDFWAENLFPLTGDGGNPTGGLDRLVYASNDFALRKRSQDLLKRQEDIDSTQTQLDFPFFSYKRTGLEFSDEGRWHNQAFSPGIYIDELETKVYMDPVSITFEGIVWCSTENDLQWLIQRLRFIADGLTEREMDSMLVYNGIDVPIWAQLNFNSINFEPQFNENDWLENNKIHTISLDFQLDTFLIRFGDPLKEGVANWSLVDEVIFTFQERNCKDETTYEEVIKLMYDELEP
jgi:hypothetical protein